MQSSPPERAWKRPSSPANSQYSIDLAALDLDSRSGATTPVAEQQIDRIRSEDIDGPSDFTINMGDLFRNGTVGRGTTKSMKKGLESLRETRDEGVQADGSFLTHKKQDDEQSASHHTPSNSPPPDSVWNLRSRLGSQRGDVSEWDPYTDGEESTPEPPALKQFLQPTVEDYYSELTPARLPSMRRAKSDSSHTQVAEEEDADDKERSSSPGRPSSETLSPVRSPARSPVRSPTRQRADPRQFSSQSTEAAFEEQLENLQAKCRQLELLNAALGQAVDEERKMRTDERTAFEKREAEAMRRERELAAVRDQADVQRGDYQKDLDELKAKVEHHEREREESGRGLELMRQQYTDEVRRISEDAQREKSAQNAKLRTLEQDLELALRNRDDAEESERVVREALDQHNAELERNHQDELDRMQSDLTQIEDPEDRVHELKEQLEEMKTQMDKLQRAKQDAQQETSDVRAELASIQQSHDETGRTTADHRRAVSLAEDLQGQLKKLREQLHNERAVHKADIDRLRDEASRTTAQESSPDLEDFRKQLDTQQTELNTAIVERDGLRDELEAQQSKLNAAILERDEAQDSLTSTRTELQEAKDVLADREAVAAAIDAKISTAIAKREAYWRGRLEASEKERKIMTKALLRQWGREEVGVTEELDGRQGYEYQFVMKESRSDVRAGA